MPLVTSAVGARGSADVSSETRQTFLSPVDELLVPQTLPTTLPPPSPSAAGQSLRQSAPQNFYEDVPHFEVERRWWTGTDVFLLVFFFLVPLALGIFYYGFYAANQYVSEFRFNVVDTSAPAPTIAGGLGSVLGGGGLGSGSSDSYTVTDFLISPQAVTEVEKKLPIRKMYSDTKWDPLYRFNPRKPKEKLDYYWQWMVNSYYDPVTNIASCEVRAFSAEDAHSIAVTLLKTAENLVNDMQTRQRADTIRFAQEALDRDNAQLAKIRTQMLSLRTGSGYIEPAASGVAENIALATSLRMTMVTDQAQRDALRGAIRNSNAPMVKALSEKIAALREQLKIVDREISNKGGQTGLLAQTVGKFDDLNAAQGAATAMMTSDLVTLQQARAQADAQHIYLATYVTPTFPSSSTFPNRPLVDRASASRLRRSLRFQQARRHRHPESRRLSAPAGQDAP